MVYGERPPPSNLIFKDYIYPENRLLVKSQHIVAFFETDQGSFIRLTHGDEIHVRETLDDYLLMMVELNADV